MLYYEYYSACSGCFGSRCCCCTDSVASCALLSHTKLTGANTRKTAQHCPFSSSTNNTHSVLKNDIRLLRLEKHAFLLLHTVEAGNHKQVHSFFYLNLLLLITVLVMDRSMNQRIQFTKSV